MLEHNMDQRKVFTLKTRSAFVVHSHLTFDRCKPHWCLNGDQKFEIVSFYAFRIRNTMMGLNFQFGKFPGDPEIIWLLFHILQLANLATVALPHLLSRFCKCTNKMYQASNEDQRKARSSLPLFLIVGEKLHQA